MHYPGCLASSPWPYGRHGAQQTTPKEAPAAVPPGDRHVTYLPAPAEARLQDPFLPAGRLGPVPRFGQILLSNGAVTPEALADALHRQRREGGRLGEILVRRGLIGHADVARALAEQFALGYYDLAAAPPGLEAMLHLPLELCRRYNVVPVAVEEDTLRVGLTDPTGTDAREAVEGLAAARQVQWVVVAEDALEAVLASREGAPTATPAANALGVVAADGTLLRGTECAVTRTILAILRRASDEGAQAIYLEPCGDQSAIRFRVDGRVASVIAVSLEEHRALLTRLTAISGLADTDLGIPRSGHFRFVGPSDAVDVAACVIPVVGGHSVTLRLTLTGARSGDLTDLGLPYASQAKLRSLLAGPPGLVVIAGPPRSGRSTALRALVGQIGSGSRRIVGCCSGAQPPLPAIPSVRVGEETGLGWSRVRGAMALQDADTLVIDEVADPQSAAICAEAAMTGSLVLATITAGGIGEALSRLRLLGIGAPVLTASLRAVYCGHLLRLTCEQCAREQGIPVAALARLRQALGTADLPRVERRGPGCVACGFTGYRGRDAVAEVAVLDAAAREALYAGEPEAGLRELCSPRGAGLPDVVRAAIEQGRTTVQEALAVLSRYASG